MRGNPVHLSVLSMAGIYTVKVPVVIVLSVFETGDVPSPQQQFLVLNNEQRSADTSGIGVDTYLSVSNITNHRHLRIQRHNVWVQQHIEQNIM